MKENKNERNLKQFVLYDDVFASQLHRNGVDFNKSFKAF